MEIPKTLAIIAGSGVYPLAMARAARAAGVPRIVAAAFQNETEPALAPLVEEIEWMRVGQLGRMLGFLKNSGATHAVMSGQIHPRNLFDLRPDIKALVVLARLRRRNAESIFGAIAEEMASLGVHLLLATTYMEEHLAPAGLIAGPKLKPREEEDLRYGFHIAKESSKLDIGQTVVVKNGSILAVEAFEGTNSAIKRGGELGRKNAIMAKVSKPNQDFRFDVPVIGPLTLEAARDARLRAIGVEAGKTLLLEREKLCDLANSWNISIFGCQPQSETPLPPPHPSPGAVEEASSEDRGSSDAPSRHSPFWPENSGRLSLGRKAFWPQKGEKGAKKRAFGFFAPFEPFCGHSSFRILILRGARRASESYFVTFRRHTRHFPC